MTAARTFAGRVARATVLAAALSAAATALLSGALAWRWTLAREDDRLRAAAATLVGEVGDDDAHAAAEADAEVAEVAPAGLRIALWQRGRRLGGDASLPPPGAPGCASERWPAGRWRRCTDLYGARSVVVASALGPLEATRDAWLAASLAAVAVAAALALALGRRAAARVVGPLARLGSAVAGVRADAPDPSALGAPEGYAEVDALRAALADLLARHGAALAQSRRFAADASHELRTPLATMRAELELAAEGADLPAELAASLARVRSTLGALSSLSERLLILAAPLDRARVDREAVALADVAREAVAALDPARRPRVAVDADDDAVVRGDAALLRALVDNALDNALKFAPEGAVAVRVAREAGRVVLRVTDEGPGVAPSERERVFEPFYRTAWARGGGARGHGVGLALVAHVARAHGGEARFEEAARGASLRVELPPWAG